MPRWSTIPISHHNEWLVTKATFVRLALAAAITAAVVNARENLLCFFQLGASRDMDQEGAPSG